MQYGQISDATNLDHTIAYFVGDRTWIIRLGFTTRGLTDLNPNQALLGRLNLILDIYRSLEILAKHPRVDSARIGSMGFSRGGQAALDASLERFHQLWNTSGVEFAAYVAFYPDCKTTFRSDAEIADRPIRIFGGTPDNYNPIAACKPYVARLKAAGKYVVLTEYPNAPTASIIRVARIRPKYNPRSRAFEIAESRKMTVCL